MNPSIGITLFFVKCTFKTDTFKDSKIILYPLKYVANYSNFWSMLLQDITSSVMAKIMLLLLKTRLTQSRERKSYRNDAKFRGGDTAQGTSRAVSLV